MIDYQIELCPFCGEFPYVARWFVNLSGKHIDVAQIKCGCGASGPEKYGNDSSVKAVAAWNKRETVVC